MSNDGVTATAAIDRQFNFEQLTARLGIENFQRTDAPDIEYEYITSEQTKMRLVLDGRMVVIRATSTEAAKAQFERVAQAADAQIHDFRAIDSITWIRNEPFVFYDI